MAERELGIGMAGVGNWGRNVLRSFASANRSRVVALCDVNPQSLSRQHGQVPDARCYDDFDAMLNDDAVEAVAIATKADTHYDLAKKALMSGRHCFVEKPLTLDVEHAEELVGLAEGMGLKLMVGHLLEYHSAVLRIREMIRAGELGEVRYICSRRVNLGVVRSDENAWWSLAPHDISVACFLLGGDPTELTVQGQSFLQPGIEDVCFGTLRFADGKIANIHVSWLDPDKVRQLTVVGSEKMVTFNDMSASEKLRVFDKNAHPSSEAEGFVPTVQIRHGDILVPHLAGGEPLATECQHFVDGVLDGAPIRSDGWDGLRVVRILDAGQKSLKANGQVVNVDTPILV